ncbi:hypothetical protein DOM22_05825 [Bdellovibrio sp. ZAP7]|nr:hypothetical protein DOM22_05825 [Bdellovibrio sp. ZAP7]
MRNSFLICGGTYKAAFTETTTSPKFAGNESSLRTYPQLATNAAPSYQKPAGAFSKRRLPVFGEAAQLELVGVGITIYG